jgi:hypothetical protein
MIKGVFMPPRAVHKTHYKLHVFASLTDKVASSAGAMPCLMYACSPPRGKGTWTPRGNCRLD